MTPRERLSTARLYLVCPARSREWIAAAVRGGVDLVQLRDKSLDDAGLVEAARAFVGHDALFILNDRPDLVEACGADGVHVGQDDQAPAAARARGGGRSVLRCCHCGGSLPTPARPGSGSTVGGPLPPSQPDRGLP